MEVHISCVDGRGFYFYLFNNWAFAFVKNLTNVRVSGVAFADFDELFPDTYNFYDSRLGRVHKFVNNFTNFH